MDFVRELRELLNRLRPAAIAPTSTAVRAELGAADLVMGHRLLQGFGLAVAVGTESAIAYWVSYSTLSRSDDFDLALDAPERVAGKFQGDGFVEAALEQVTRELARRFILRAEIRSDRLSALTAFIPAAGTPEKPLWRRRYGPRWKALAPAPHRHLELCTSFMSETEDVAELIATVS